MPGDKVWLERVLYELDQIGRKLRRIFCRQLNQKHFPLASRCDLLSSGHETFPWFSFFGSSSPSPSSGNIAEQAKRQMESLPESVLMDVRGYEWLSEHAAGAVHLGKGILERDIETRFLTNRHLSSCIVGGGYRSADR